MTLLIDAFNVLYKLPDLEEHMHRGQLVEARRGLLELLIGVRKRWKKKLEFHLFFDGKKKPGDEIRQETVSDFQIYYSHDLSADHLIKEYIKHCHSPGEIQVVSSDKDILLFARQHRCHVQTSEDFASWVNGVLTEPKTPEPEKETDPQLSTGELDYWMKLFGKGKRRS